MKKDTDREKILERQRRSSRRYYQANREEIRDYNRRYYLENREKIREQRRKKRYEEK